MFDLKTRILVLVPLLCLLAWDNTVAFALEPDQSRSLPHGASFVSLPVKPFQWRKPKKEALAQAMSAWTIQTLLENHARVGVVARQGPYLTRLFDRTGMTHSGFVFQHPATGEWITYSLYSIPETGSKTAQLWRQSLKDFFYGQRSNHREALLLIPKPALQTEILKRFYANPFVPLLPQNHHYNLIAPLQSPISFNCTKWVVLQLYAARENMNDVPSLIQVMQREYRLKTVRPKLITRLALKRKPDVNWEELDPPGTIQTVTVDSLSQSDLFDRFFLYSGKLKFRGVRADAFKPTGENQHH